MRKSKQTLITILLVCVFAADSLPAQRRRPDKPGKSEKICGEYTYLAPDNVTPAQAWATAEERARIQALQDHYGNKILSFNSTVTGNINGESYVDFFSLSGSDLNGEWLSDDPDGIKREPVYSEGGHYVYKVSVCGTAREKANVPYIDLDTKIVKGKTERFETDEFRNGEHFYLQFQSPVAGYLSVYLLDDLGNMNCLLPYRNDPDGIAEVGHGKLYTFFDRDGAEGDERAIVDEYYMTTGRTTEVNYFFVIFSPNKFVKANDRDAGEELPRALPSEDFQKWLQMARLRDPDMQFEIVPVRISQK